MRGILNLAVGLAVGYGLSRLMEARALGVPLDQAFKLDANNLLTPVAQLRLGTTLTNTIKNAPQIIDVQAKQATNN